MKVESIAILGGGTSAWLTAAYLCNNHPAIKITVIDKSIGNPVGVGEGTLLRFVEFINQCGLEFEDIFREVGATFKNGILFKNWQEDNKDIWHPFIVNPSVESEDGLIFKLMDVWSNHQDFNFKRYGTGLYDVSMQNGVCDNFDLAYHVDCGKLVTYLQNFLVDKITFIQSEMVEFQSSDENIDYLTLDNKSKIYADLFIDCTGFKSVLNDNPEKIDLSDRLFCNTACAGHVPYQNKNTEMVPYVVSEALDVGWAWTIPVRDRIGSGLVFNRNITEIDDAKKIFCDYWNGRITESDLKIIDWDPFYNKNMWHGNCVSIGLSAGFIEPLESTGIALIIEGIYQLSNRIKDGFVQDYDADVFNSMMIGFFEECVDFVNMHYYNNARSSQFWTHVKNTHKISKKHQHYLDMLSKDNKSLDAVITDTNFFTNANWYLWLIQQGEQVASRQFVDAGFERSKKCLTSWKKFNDSQIFENHCDLIKRLNA